MVKKRSPRRKTSASSTSPRASSHTAQRLNKILAAAGLGSRRKVEELIEQGRVQIDGEVVTDLACKVDPAVVKIKVDGELLKRARKVYFALNKPSGVLSTNYDPSGRVRVVDFVPDRDRVFSVGRLDQHSEGLMLLTNDGELAQRLAHPKFRIQKTYFVVVAGQLSEDELSKLRKGVHLAEGFARIDGAAIKRVRQGCTELEIVLSEGKNREIRRILARAGHKVVLLRRLAIGPLRLGQLPVGAARELSPAEVKALFAATEAGKAQKPTRPRTAGKPASTSAKAQSPVNAVEEDDDDLLSLAYQSSGGLSDDDGDDDDLLFSSAKGDALPDDDFISDVSGIGRTGSVLAFDDYDAASPATRPQRPRRAGASARTGAGKGESTAKMPRNKLSRAKSPSAKSRSAKSRSAKRSAPQAKAAPGKPAARSPSSTAPLRAGRKAAAAKGPRVTAGRGTAGRARRPGSKRGKR